MKVANQLDFGSFLHRLYSPTKQRSTVNAVIFITVQKKYKSESKVTGRTLQMIKTGQKLSA
jgi:hypothetical protein